MIGKFIGFSKNLIKSLNTLAYTMYDVAWAELTIGMKADVAKAKILEMGKAFLATPIGKITLIVAAVAGIAAVVTSATDAWQKQVEAAQEAIKVNEENIANYQNEIDSLEALQEKLQNAKGDKEALAAIQEELNEAIGATPGLINGEASAYEAATQKIKDQIAATKELLETQRQELVDNNSAIFNAYGAKQSFLGIDWLVPDTSGAHMRKIINDYYKKYNDLLSKGFSDENAKKTARSKVVIQYGPSGLISSPADISEKEWSEYWNSQVATAYKVFESTISSYNGFGGSDFIKQIIDNSVRRGRTLEEINAIIGEISNSPFQSLLNDYYESLSDPNADSQAIYDDLISKIDELKTKYPELADTFDLYSKHITDKLNSVSEAAEGATSAVKSFTDIADSFQDGYDAIVNAQKDIEDQNYLSIDSVKALEKAGLSDYLKETEYGYLLVNDALNTYLEAQGKKYKDALDTAISQASSLATMQDAVAAGYKNDASGLATYLRVLGAANNAMARNEFKNNLISKGFTVTEAHRMWMSSQQRIAADQAQSEYIAAANAIDAAIKNQKTYEMVRKTAQNDTKHSSDSKSGKTEAEKYFEKLKYWRDTNKITELKYYQDLAYYAKQYYKQGKISLDEYASHTEEVYNWLKEQRKKDYEDDIEKLEKKKDAVSEYYDKLREEIENTHDEEDYEKEQSEKRKEIFDLDMQIAELMRDGSEKAKARIAELEEERLKAEEELRDFETDKAREDELSRLEKEQESEEKKIQDKIDGIQGQLDKLDEDTISVRNAIISYARAKGVTLDFAYASGTRSSVGGFGRINEKGIEMISAPDGNGNYVNLMPDSYVFSAKATEFLWKLATEHSLPQAMYNSIAKSIKTQSSTPSVNIAQPITITMGDIIIKGNADKQTVADIKKEQENTVRMVLQKIKELQK